MGIVKKMLIILLVVSLFVITACGGGAGSDTAGGEESTTDPSTEKPLLDARHLDNPVVRILTCYPLFDAYEDSFKEYYGGEIEQIIIPIQDNLSKLASMVMSEDSPDGMVNHSDFVAHFASYIANDLVQPFDEHIDINEPIYDKLRFAMEEAKWNGKYYFISNGIEITEATLFNVKLFEQVGIDNPWELYQRDEWTWDAFKEVAEMLAQDSDNDDQIDIYGGTMWAPEILIGTSGKPLGNIIDQNNIQLLIKDNDIVRALQFAYDFNYKNDFALNPPTAWAQAFTRERLAMALVPSWVVTTPEVVAIAQAGNLGIAPLPRDPKHDKTSTKATMVGLLLPKDAPNPEGVVALNKCRIYDDQYNEEKQSERQEAAKTTLFFTDENIEQWKTVTENPDYVSEWVKGFVHNYLWGFWEQENPWSTYVESIEPILEAEIRQATKSTE